MAESRPAGHSACFPSSLQKRNSHGILQPHNGQTSWTPRPRLRRTGALRACRSREPPGSDPGRRRRRGAFPDGREKGRRRNYRTSIVDLLKLLDLDSSLDARKELAQELKVNAGAHGSAEQNIALQKAVMRELAKNGGKVPDSLKD